MNKPNGDTFYLNCNLLHRFFNSKCVDKLYIINGIYTVKFFTFRIILFLDITMLRILLDKTAPLPL